MKKIHQILFILILTCFIVPDLTSAYWWNPMSWFKTNQESKKIILISTSTESYSSTTDTVTKTTSTFYWWNPITWFHKKQSMEPKPDVQKDQNNDQERETNKNGTTTQNIEKIVPKKQEQTSQIPKQPTTSTSSQTDKNTTEINKKPESTSTTPIQTDVNDRRQISRVEEHEVQNVIQLTELKISNIEIVTNTNSTKISWQTNIPTISKIFFGDYKVANSESGLSTKHFTTLNNLESNTSYTYEIEAVAELSVSKYKSSFKTNQDIYELRVTGPEKTLMINQVAAFYVELFKNNQLSPNPFNIIIETPDTTQNKTLSGKEYGYQIKNEGDHKIVFSVPDLKIKKEIIITGHGVKKVDASITLSSEPNNQFSINLKTSNPNPEPSTFQFLTIKTIDGKIRKTFSKNERISGQNGNFNIQEQLSPSFPPGKYKIAIEIGMVGGYSNIEYEFNVTPESFDIEIL